MFCRHAALTNRNRKPEPSELFFGKSLIWEFGEGVDSARGVAAIVVCCRNSSCNSSCDSIPRNGRRTIAFFLLFRVQLFVCNRLCEGMFQTCFECGRHGEELQSHPLPISPLLQTPKFFRKKKSPMSVIFRLQLLGRSPDLPFLGVLVFHGAFTAVTG